jgi:uncharacterized DUF497 family protein
MYDNAVSGNPAKAAINLRKHAISFDIAMRVFADPFALTEEVRIEGGEQRWQTLGIVEGYLLLLLAHTTRDHPHYLGPSGRPERKATL